MKTILACETALRVAVFVLGALAGGCAANRAGVRSSWSPVRVRVAPEFRYVGRQEFILHEKVEVEQFLFAVASQSGDVERLVWIQYERFLPGAEGVYNYDKSDTVTLGGLEFVVNVRQYVMSPEAGSDRSRAYELLASRGLRLEGPATRVRLVHVPAGDPRSEVMLVYAEGGTPVAELPATERAAYIARAVASVSIDGDER